MTDRTLRFFYEFASTYSYLAAMRIEDLAASRKVEIAWTPFMLGPVFRAQGLDNSPFNIFPEKGRYMWRDMQRLADSLDLPLVRPDPFPQNGLLSARLAIAGLKEGWTPQFSRAVYFAEFGEGRDISDVAVLTGILNTIGVDAGAALASAGTDDVKQSLKNNGAEAVRHHVFGAPSFVAPDGEMFWGNDRLEAALDWVDARA